MKNDYLKTLPEGEHEVRVEFVDGSVATKIKVTKKTDQPAAVNTGDVATRGLWIALYVALIGMAGTMLIRTPSQKTRTKIKPRRKVR